MQISGYRRKAALIIAVFAVAFAVVVARQLRPRSVPAVAPGPPRTDPGAVVESTGGRIERVKQSREKFRLDYERQLSYANGSAKMFGITIVADRNDGSTFTAKAKEALVGPEGDPVELTGDVRLTSSDLHAHAEHATYAKADDIVRALGPVEVTEGRTTAKGVGMTFDRANDVLVILDQAAVRTEGDTGAAATEITSATATFARREHYRRFEQHVRLQRGGEVIESENALAYLSDDDSRIEKAELRGGARITTAASGVGAVQSLTGTDVNLNYAPTGEALQHVAISGNADIQLAGDAGKPGRKITANAVEIALAPDGSTPVALLARDGVLLTMPPEPGEPARTIHAALLDAKGQAGKGITRAQFSGTVQYRERGGPHDRAANANVMVVNLKPGMGAIDDASFSQAVKFVQGAMTATAAAGRYDLVKGTLALSGSEPGALAPRIVDEQIAVDAGTIDVVLDGPKMKAAGGAAKVKSVLLPVQKAGQKPADNRKMPSMLKSDQPVNVTADALDYDGAASNATYTGGAQLWQGDTSIKGDTITIDDKTGDMAASGSVTSTTMLQQDDKKTQKKERSRSIATADDLKYEDAVRRLTYTGDAHMSGPEGDMTAAKIELYLKPSGDELERAEAYEDVTLREQNRKTTGNRMTYTTADERYVIVGTPVTIVDECQRETTGRTLTFLKATDNIIVDGNQQTRTQTKGGGKCSS